MFAITNSSPELRNYDKVIVILNMYVEMTYFFCYYKNNIGIQ